MSDPAKLLRHREALIALAKDRADTVIHAHVSPTGECNLNCAFCSYGGRARDQSLPIDGLIAYTEQLVDHGLRAVTLTGGGEPLLYKDINPYVEWCSRADLHIGLITNGFMWKKLQRWDALSWVRVSVNMADGWLGAIDVPDGMQGTRGMSVVWDGHTISDIGRLLLLADKIKAEYIRILPSYLLADYERERQYNEIELVLARYADPRLTVLYNNARAPQCGACFQHYLKPYLAEDGFIYQCCASILGAPDRKLPVAHCVCHMDYVEAFLIGEFPSEIVPSEDCAFCTYADSVEALYAWVTGTASRHDLFV